MLMLMMYKSKRPKHKYRFIKPSLKARLDTKTIAKVSSGHLADSTSVTRQSVSDREVALAGGLGLHAHDAEHSQPLFT